MRFCQEHWNALRRAIDERGLSSLISEGGEQAMRNVVSELEEGRTIDNYDPLMSAHFAIAGNVMRTIERAGGNPLYLMAGPDVPEDPVEGYGPEYEGRTWPRCPLCYLNLAHELSCSDERCTLPKERGYDWMLDRAADDQVEAWKAMKP